jgi:uncharacterized protein HemX
MQPDPLTPPQEEKKPGQEPLQPEPHYEPEARLLNPTPAPPPVQSVQPVPVRPAPVPVQAKKPSQVGGIAAVLLGLVVVVLLVAVIGVGFWAYSLNTKLASTQQQLTALQGDYSKLQTDYTVLTSEKEKLSADLTQAQADLDKANADLATAKTDLQAAQDETKAVTAKMGETGKLADILFTWFTINDSSSILKLDSQIKATDDTKLKSLWDQFMASPTNDKVTDVLIYIVTTLRDDLK